MKLNLSADELLSTTRAVRKRLDLTRPVPRAIIEECLELALQAPNGSNRNLWRWIIVDDPVLIAKLADEYRASVKELWEGQAAGDDKVTAGVPGEDKVLESAFALVEKLDKVPAMLVPLMPGRPDGLPAFGQGPMWSSIIQAVWSFMLALRERGLGSVWTTVSIRHEKQIAELLGIPMDEYTQVGLFPVAYTIGTDFKKAWRKPVSEVLTYNRF
ncbi:MAG: nitroreductase family protein [Sphingomonadales bacterium]|nr:MAG: nitroreductase family protein [Sphingomonadales bacterium]